MGIVFANDFEIKNSDKSKSAVESCSEMLIKEWGILDSHDAADSHNAARMPRMVALSNYLFMFDLLGKLY